MYYQSTDCCGLNVLENVSSHREPSAVIRDMQKTMKGIRAPYMVYSMPTDYKIGEELFEFIQKEKLGTVIKTDAVININSGNDLVVYTWTVNWKALHKWGQVPTPIKKVTTLALKKTATSLRRKVAR